MKYNEQTSKLIRSDIIRLYLKRNTIRKITNECNCSTSTVMRWIKYYRSEAEDEKRRIIYDNETILKKINNIDLKRKTRKKRSTILKKVANYITKKCANKTTGGKDNCSIRKIVAIANRKFKLNKDLKHKLTINKVHRFLSRKFGRPRKLIKKPLLKENHIKRRKAFAKYIIENNVDHNKIFFTDEKRFLLSFVPNPQNNKIRLNKESKRKLKQNNDEIVKKITVEVEKHPKGVMVAGGFCSYGIGKLNFCVGTMNSFAYRQTLLNYEKDMDYFKNLGIELTFQQDNAPCHISKGSKGCLKNINNKLKFWPPNSPDLSPIETVWSFIQQKLEGYKFKTLHDLKKKIVFYWNRIPQDYCQRICDKFFSDIKQLYKVGKIKEKNNPYKKIILKKRGIYEDTIENIVYNEKALKKFLKNKRNQTKEKIKKQKNIVTQMNSKKIQKELKKRINAIHFDICLKEIIKSKEEELGIMEKEFEKLKNMDEDTYFNNLSMDKKEKLVGLNEDGLDEETQADEKIWEIFDRNLEMQKRSTKKKIEETFKKIIERKNLIRRLRKEVTREAAEEERQ